MISKQDTLNLSAYMPLSDLIVPKIIRAAGLFGMEIHSVTTIFAVNLKRILRLLKENESALCKMI